LEKVQRRRGQAKGLQ